VISLPKIPYIFHIQVHGYGQPYCQTVYDRIFSDFPASHHIYVYIYKYTVMASPIVTAALDSFQQTHQL